MTKEKTIKSIGAIYEGKNVHGVTDHYVWLYPFIFFWRRTLYVVITVYLFEWPSLQAQAHVTLSLITACSLAVDPCAFESTAQKVI